MTSNPTKKEIYITAFKIVFAHHLAFTGDRLYDLRRFDKDARWESYAATNNLDIERDVWGYADHAFKDKTNKQVFYQALVSAFNFVHDPQYTEHLDSCDLHDDAPHILIDIVARIAWKHDSLGHTRA